MRICAQCKILRIYRIRIGINKPSAACRIRYAIPNFSPRLNHFTRARRIVRRTQANRHFIGALRSGAARPFMRGAELKLAFSLSSNKTRSGLTQPWGKLRRIDDDAPRTWNNHREHISRSGRSYLSDRLWSIVRLCSDCGVVHHRTCNLHRVRFCLNNFKPKQGVGEQDSKRVRLRVGCVIISL